MKAEKKDNRLDDILFSTKNKIYGAYVHRKKYGKKYILSFIIGMGSMVLLFALPIIIWWLKGEDRTSVEVVPVSLTPASELVAPPPVIPEKPPEPKPQTAPPQVKTKRFVKPEVKPDEEVVDEDPVPTMDELKEANPSTVTQEGTTDTDIDYVIPIPEAKPAPETGLTEESPEEDEVFTFVEQLPEFPGGQGELQRFIAENIKYPEMARKNNIQGVVVVRFIVRPDGSTENFEVVRGIGGGCDEEALRVMRSMPDWIPGSQNNRIVSVKMTVPIRFVLR